MNCDHRGVSVKYTEIFGRIHTDYQCNNCGTHYGNVSCRIRKCGARLDGVITRKEENVSWVVAIIGGFILLTIIVVVVALLYSAWKEAKAKYRQEHPNPFSVGMLQPGYAESHVANVIQDYPPSLRPRAQLSDTGYLDLGKLDGDNLSCRADGALTLARRFLDIALPIAADRVVRIDADAEFRGGQCVEGDGRARRVG
jgi:hypothetical protein